MRTLPKPPHARKEEFSSRDLPIFYKVTHAPYGCEPGVDIFRDYDAAMRHWKKFADRILVERKGYIVGELSIRVIEFPEVEWAQIVSGMLPVHSGLKANG